ncbi:MAG: response regulator transcription factor [Bacteroidota bacterium]
MEQLPIKVAYADDHTAVRKGMISTLSSFESINVIIEGENGKDLLNKLLMTEVIPDVCLLDINMPVMNGATLLKEIKKRWPNMGCLVFTAFDMEYYIFEMIRSGANGYLLKSCDPNEIYKAIQSIYDTGYYYSEFANDEVYELIKSTHFKKDMLNNREVELLRYVCSELSYSEIAIEMKVSYKTICGIKDRLCSKLKLSSRVSLMLAAIQLGYGSIKNPKTN